MYPETSQEQTKYRPSTNEVEFAPPTLSELRHSLNALHEKVDVLFERLNKIQEALSVLR